MATLQTDVLVIGGGSTGVGVAWDAAMRGFSAVLVDRGDLATGTTGRFHGLLHSGGRYVVKDPKAAEECIDENRDPAADRRRLHRGHRRAVRHDPHRRPGVRRPVRPGLPDRRRPGRGDPRGRGAAPGAAPEPRDLPRLHRARRQRRRVEDRVGAAPGRPRRTGARILPYHEVLASRRRRSGAGARCATTARGGEDLDIEADFVVNASGAWAGQIAEMAGCRGHGPPGQGDHDRDEPPAGEHGASTAARCRPTATSSSRSGPSSVIGTTDEQVADPDDWHDHPGRGQNDAGRRREARARASARRGRCACGPGCGRLSRTQGRGRPTRATSPARTRCSTTGSATASSGS